MRIFSTVIIGVIVVMSAAQAKNDEIQPKAMRMIKITVREHEFTAMLEDNATVAAFLKKLPLTIEMNDFNANEKCYSFTERLPVDAVNPWKIQSGDLMLYGSSTLVLFYESFATSYSYTRMGKINDVSQLKTALGGGNPTVTFELIEPQKNKTVTNKN